MFGLGGTCHINPIRINFPDNSDFEIVCQSKAPVYQRITILDDGRPVTRFVADHDDMPMKLPDGSTSYSRNSAQFTRLALLFEYSETGPNGPFRKSMLTSDPNSEPFIAIVTLQTETAGALKWRMKLHASRQSVSRIENLFRSLASVIVRSDR
jgi:hypothetical protein